MERVARQAPGEASPHPQTCKTKVYGDALSTALTCRTMFAHLTLFWNSLSLARRFALAAGPVLLFGMTILGLWVSGRIVEGVVNNTAALTVLYLDGIIAPLNDELAAEAAPPAVALRALDETFNRPDNASRFVAFRIWRPDGTLVYSRDASQIGQKFVVNVDLARAFKGDVVAEYGPQQDENTALTLPASGSLMEIYAPIREVWSGRIIAAAEVYQTADVLAADLRDSRRKTWLVVAASALGMAAVLFRIVLRGSRMIDAQQAALQNRLAAMQIMAEQNRNLRLHVQAASGRASSLNERYLRRISADLHDGPAQNLAVAALRLPRLGTIKNAAGRATELAEIREVLDSAMREIRGISRGLVLPELEGMPLPTLLERVTAAHETRTQTQVTSASDGIDAMTMDLPRNICVYRFVQEGLTNAFKHGGGTDQRVAASCLNGVLTVSVSDKGEAAVSPTESGGLGLAGLQERVESLGGAFAATRGNDGATITMTLALDET